MLSVAEDSNPSVTSCHLATRRAESRGDVKPGTCEYLQNRREFSLSAKPCESLDFVSIVPKGRPVQAGKRGIDIKHCCVSPCSSPVINLAGLKLVDQSFASGKNMTQDEVKSYNDLSNGHFKQESHDCDATGRLKNRRDTSDIGQCNQGKLNSCADSADDIFNGRCSDVETTKVADYLDPNNNGQVNNMKRYEPTIERSLCTAPVIESLPDLVAELHHIFADDHVNVEYVEHVMKSYKSKPVEWQKYAKFDKFKYTRNLVDAGNDKFNLMILCWGEGHGSAVHDHADAHCFMKMLDGGLTETRFHWPASQEESEKPLKVMGKSQLMLNDVCYINDSLGLHRVENSSYCNKAVSLHLYSPPFDACSVFNERTGHKTVSRVTFWSKFGKRDKKTELTDGSQRVEMEDN